MGGRLGRKDRNGINAEQVRAVAVLRVKVGSLVGVKGRSAYGRVGIGGV